MVEEVGTGDVAAVGRGGGAEAVVVVVHELGVRGRMTKRTCQGGGCEGDERGGCEGGSGRSDGNCKGPGCDKGSKDKGTRATRQNTSPDRRHRRRVPDALLLVPHHPQKACCVA